MAQTEADHTVSSYNIKEIGLFDITFGIGEL